MIASYRSERIRPDGAAIVGVASLSESIVETVVLDWLASLGWAVLHGPDIAPDMLASERTDYGVVVLTSRLRAALARLIPTFPTMLSKTPCGD